MDDVAANVIGVERETPVPCVGPVEMHKQAKSVGLVESEILSPIERDFES